MGIPTWMKGSPTEVSEKKGIKGTTSSSFQSSSNCRLHYFGVTLIVSLLVTGVICQEASVAGNALKIIPESKSNRVYQRALGKSSIFTCQANVEHPDRLTEFTWFWPDGKKIEATDNRVEIMRDSTGSSLTLLFTSIQEQDLGKYQCTAVYANTQRLSTDFELRAFVPITFEDAPLNQYAVKGQDYKVKCRVKADPEPQVDWKKDHRVINNSDHFVMDKDGVVIRDVTEADEGVYTCRVRVVSMGTVEERHIQVEVHEFPTLISEPQTIEGVEDESVTLQCLASGKPSPEYEWVNHRHQDLRVLERHTVDKYKGTLQIDGIKREDAGEYTCTARNTAGYVTMKSKLNVVTKPVIEEFKNVTSQINGNAVITCRATGDPAPDIRFHKDSNREPFTIPGPQHDARIFFDQRKNGRMTVATLKITDLLRTDDGLYNCIAYNQRTKTELLGHITVEYPPTFVNSPMREAWSWDGRAVNLTCLAEGIPNATVAWFIEGAPERAVDNNMPNIKQIGFQSSSSLEIRPIDRSLYGFYKCVATNKLGTAEHRVQLREARKPGPILDAIVVSTTATSITYKIVGPTDNGGLAVKNFIVQYKEDRKTWDDHRLKSWSVDQQLFTIEGLEPMRSYHVRFAAENEVGTGNWALEKVVQTPRRSAPEPVIILNEINGNSAAITAYPDKFELIWRVPPDNGEKIEAFEISYTPVRNLTVNKGTQVEYQWEPVGQKLEEERPLGEPRHVLRNLSPGSFYKVEIRARNAIGRSSPATIIIKTAPIPGGSYDLIKGETTAVDQFPLMILIILVSAVLVVLFLVDISCYRINNTGIIWTISNKMCNRKKSRESLVKARDGSIHEKKPLKEGDLGDDSREHDGPKTNGNGTSNGNGTTSITIPPSHITHTHNHNPKDSEV